MPKSDVPGEQAWPTQPFPTKPAPFGSMTFTVDDVNPWLATPEQYEAMKRARGEGPQRRACSHRRRLTDTISMPGNQGGSNWGTTAANPEKGLVFVVNVNQVAILKLEDVRDAHAARGPRRRRRQGGVPLQAGFLAYQQHCTACHGANLRGALPGVTDRSSASRIASARTRSRRSITGGKGKMRPVSGITDAEMAAVIAYLALSSASGGRGGRGGGRGGGPPVVAARTGRRDAAARHSRRRRRASSARSIPASAAMPATCRIPRM